MAPVRRRRLDRPGASSGPVVVAGADSRAGKMVAEALGGFDVAVVEGPGVGQRPREGCVVVCTDTLGSSALAQIADLATAYPFSRLLIVCPLTPEHVRALDALSLIPRAVWLQEVEDELADRVSEILARDFLEQAVEALNAAVELPEGVGRFITAVWTSGRPPTTLAAGAELAAIHESTLREQWAALGFRAHLKDVVEWAILGRALAEREEGVSWDRAAFRVRTTGRTLRRITHRRFEWTLTELEAKGGRPLVAEQFWAWFDDMLGPAWADNPAADLPKLSE